MLLILLALAAAALCLYALCRACATPVTPEPMPAERESRVTSIRLTGYTSQELYAAATECWQTHRPDEARLLQALADSRVVEERLERQAQARPRLVRARVAVRGVA